MEEDRRLKFSNRKKKIYPMATIFSYDAHMSPAHLSPAPNNQRPPSHKLPEPVLYPALQFQSHSAQLPTLTNNLN